MSACRWRVTSRLDGMLVGAPTHFASLSERSDLQSLRTRVRESDGGPALVSRILRDRLGPWYSGARDRRGDFQIADLLSWHLQKAPTFGADFPPPWSDFLSWVESDCGCPWSQVPLAVDAALSSTFDLPAGPVHGDLHTQNVLVDELGECFPIDFGWTRSDSSPLIDVVMLECSLKYLALPMRSDLRPLLHVEGALAAFDSPELPDGIPYGDEAHRVFATVAAVREFALNDLGIGTDAYRSGLLAMTFALASHPGLNKPYMLASLQVQSSALLEVL